MPTDDITTPAIASNAADVAEAERNAPLITGGPLPLKVQSLGDVPKQVRGQYGRLMGGGFGLVHIYSNDTESMTAHHAELGRGKIKVLSEGETPEILAERAKAGEAMVAQALRMADEVAAKRKAERAAELQKRFDAEHAELRRKYGLGM